MSSDINNFKAELIKLRTDAEEKRSHFVPLFDEEHTIYNKKIEAYAEVLTVFNRIFQRGD